MCRMLLGLGQIDMENLIDNFATIARDENEQHEENATLKCLHEHGWGIIYEQAGHLKFYKSAKPCYHDKQFYDFKALKTSLVVLHARRNTKGVISYENAHPFWYVSNGETMAFCHNGTVQEQLPFDNRFKLQGDVDSEGYFYHILSHLDPRHPVASYRKTILGVKDFTAINSFLVHKDLIMSVTRYHVNPNYYTMKMSTNENSIIISSEVLPFLQHRTWEKIPNNTLIELRRRPDGWKYHKWNLEENGQDRGLM